MIQSTLTGSIERLD